MDVDPSREGLRWRSSSCYTPSSANSSASGIVDEPDLNDSVVLNIAPLWEPVAWKEAKAYWDDLMKGEYEWSSIGKQRRAKGLVT